MEPKPRRHGDGPAGTIERPTEATAEGRRQDAPGQRGQPSAGAGHGRGESKKDAGRPAAGRLDYASVVRGCACRNEDQ